VGRNASPQKKTGFWKGGGGGGGGWGGGGVGGGVAGGVVGVGVGVCAVGGGGGLSEPNRQTQKKTIKIVIKESTGKIQLPIPNTNIL